MPVEVLTTYRTEPASLFQQEVREIFRNTLVLGKPLEGTLENFELYEEMSVGWYLKPENPGSAVVLDDNTGEVMGYVLICTQPDEYADWLRRQAWRVFRRNALALVTGRLSKVSRQFYGRRFLDSLTVVRTRSKHDAGSAAHVHMNLRPEVRTGLVALSLYLHADTVCRDAGLDTWIGEVNAVEGTRMRALERLVGEIVDVQKNRTASFFNGTKVNRLTVRRSVPSVM